LKTISLLRHFLESRLNEGGIDMGKERQFIVDERGQKIAVVISIQEYREMLEELEDIEALREFEEAKASGETPVPFDEAIARIERNRK
jgi:PHD/YefM family antitoxin component YafN of YafNO toxin-antitoxin module